MKMEKTPRYTQRERNMVLGFAAQYKDVIENKRTDAESNRKKDEVWRQIAKEFNCRVYHQRSSKQLRQLYKNMKLLLKKDLCGGGGGGGGSGASGGGGGSTGGPCAPAGNCNGAGDNKSNRSFMDILNALSQQDSVAQYISEQMSPSGYSSSRQQKFDDDFDDSKLPSVAYDGLDNDVIVIKSEDISDNEQSSQNGAGCGDDMDDDDDDCLSPKDIPEVCLEEEDDEIFATDLRQPAIAQQQQQQQQQQQCLNLQLAQQQSTPQQTQQLQPEITIQNVGGIRVGSIGSMAHIANAAKALLNGTTATNSISNNNNNNSNNNSITQPNNGKNATNNTSSALNISLTTTSTTTTTNNSRATLSAEQQQREQQQHLLFSGLGLSAVHAANDQQQPQLPILQHATQRLNTHNNSHLNSRSSSINNNNNNRHNSLLAIHSGSASNNTHNKLNNSSHNSHHPNHHNNKNGNSGSANNNNNDYLMSLAIEERRRKIDLLNAQIEYWKTLTKKLDANNGHNPTPSCLCHFPPAKLNGLQSQQSSS